ncbi:ribokinase [Pelagibacteraceae bacterium]|jgi:ribokinase|nr:ribokinase [Pelagibacteraceae bacterium]|tara:strand:- start:620 stop:1522 length:903 start_codon:yes stop_codon:yes gene_type:complete
MGYISVLGIFVADISFSGNKIPSIGETILGNSYNIGPGGKGCNQAIAIARLGGKVNFISKIGKDDYGQLALNTLDQNKIDTSAIIQSQNQQTGVAGIMVDKKTGKNAINVITGAASTLTINEVNKNIDKIKNSKIFLTQLEIPKDVTLYSLKIAKENKVLTILNPAPASKISKEFFNYIDYFTPNETEAEFYTGIKITNEKEAKEASIKLLNIGLKRVIITLGEKGLFYSDGKEEIYLKATQVKAIDTTGAGDAFNGGLAYALSQNKSIKDSLNLANQVAGLSTLKLGAGNAMPLLSDLG